MSIEIGRSDEDKRPQIICQKCKKIAFIDITQWKNDASKIWRDNCPHCGVEIYMGILLIGHTDLRQLMATVQVMIDAVSNSGKEFYGDGKNNSPIHLI